MTETMVNQSHSSRESTEQRKHVKHVSPPKQSVMTRDRVGGVKPRNWSAKIQRGLRRTKGPLSKVVGDQRVPDLKTL